MQWGFGGAGADENSPFSRAFAQADAGVASPSPTTMFDPQAAKVSNPNFAKPSMFTGWDMTGSEQPSVGSQYAGLGAGFESSPQEPYQAPGIVNPNTPAPRSYNPTVTAAGASPTNFLDQASNQSNNDRSMGSTTAWSPHNDLTKMSTDDIKTFQENQGLKVDGVAGRATNGAYLDKLRADENGGISGWLGNNADALKAGAGVLSAGYGIFQGNKQRKMAEDMFAFNKAQAVDQNKQNIFAYNENVNRANFTNRGGQGYQGKTYKG